MTGGEIYKQSIDKQRILVVGGGSDLIISLLVHTLNSRNRKFDFVANGKPVSIKDDSPVILVDGNTPQLIDYKHHILLLGPNTSSESIANLEALADATPKGGTIIYPKNNSLANKVGSKERTDVQGVSYETYKHQTVDGKTILVSSTNEKYPIPFRGESELQCISAAKELLKKIGISSGSFYKAMSEYKVS